jgi:transposase
MLDSLSNGDVLLADCAYDSDTLRIDMIKRGVWQNIRPMPNRKQTPLFGAVMYKARNKVENFFNKIKHYRTVATRYDKRDDNFLASVQTLTLQLANL